VLVMIAKPSYLCLAANWTKDNETMAADAAAANESGKENQEGNCRDIADLTLKKEYRASS
jgi:hypothetical protein